MLTIHRPLTSLLILLLELVAGGAYGAPAADDRPPRRDPPAAIRLQESTGHTLAAWPVSSGFPLPAGLVHDASKLHLKAGDRAVATQGRILSRWPDGSARWVLLDWQTDLKPQQISDWHVEPGTSPPPPSRVRVQDSEASIDIDTGPLRFRIPKRRPALMENIELNGKAVTSQPVTCFLTVAGKRNPCLAPTSVRVIDAGPLRARIEMRGRYTSDFAYVVRIDAYAGKPFVRVLHTFEQHSSEPFLDVQQIALAIPFVSSTPAHYRFGVDGKSPIAGRLAATGSTLVQADNLGFEVDGKKLSGHAAGWAALQTDTHGVAIAARSFWQEYPKSIELRSDHILYNLWAPQAAPAKVGSGAAKTHELAIHFSAKEPAAAATLDALAGGVPLAHAAPEWTTHTQALRNGLVLDVDGRAFLKQLEDGYRRQSVFTERERWDDSGAARCSPGRERPRIGFYGMFNWGDWNFPGYHDDIKGCDAWGNLEYDTTQVLALAFAASGQSRYADAMVAAARHFMDVDTIHFSSSRPQWVGMNHPKNPLHFTFDLGGIDLGHTWTEGLLSYYLFSGDERALEVARGIGDHLAARIRRGQVKGNPRQWGWPQIALVALYEITGDDSYRRAAADYARGGMAAHPPEVRGDWKLGVLAEGLAYTDSVASEPPIRAWLSRYAAAVLAYSAVADPRFMPALAYIGTSTQQPQYSEAARRSAQRLTFGKWAKPFTIAGRIGFSILGSQRAPHGESQREDPTRRRGDTETE